MLDTRRRLTLRRKYIQRLISVRLTNYHSFGDNVWDAALSLTPKLKLLDLREYDVFDGEKVSWLVRAAGRRCLEIETLNLAPYIPASSEEAETEEMRELAQLVFQSAEQWKNKTGGLRYLTMNMSEAITDHASAKSYIDSVVRYCPRIELLDGYKDDVERGDCGEQWWLDLDTWQRFCQTCTELIEFDWIVVPFTTRFFEIFAQTPHLKHAKVDFQVAANWKWKKYLEQVDSATRTALEASGFGLTATNAQVVLAACPALEEVSVDREIHGVDFSRTKKQGLDLEVFSDGFCEALAKHCRQLTRLEYGEPRRVALAPPLVRSFTDRAMRALASLPRLEFVQLGAVNITGDGLFDLVVDHAADSSATRRYVIHYGDASMTFYKLIERF